ncbi:MAG: CapA family protein [Dehalobacterium sp.]
MKKVNQKRVLSLITIAVLLATILPVSLFAAETDTLENQNPPGITGKIEAENLDILDEDDEIVNIPDPALELCIRRALHKPDGDITKTDMLQLEDLNAYNNNIKDLTGLEYAKNLRVAQLDNNQIRDVGSLSGLTNLTLLILSDNEISDISSLSGMTNLSDLWLDNNEISDISSLPSMTNLIGLNISDNKIKDISSLSGMTNLKGLSLINNEISDISSLSGLTNVTTLELTNNEISDISSLSGMKNLVRLVVANNQISAISSLSSMPELRYLSLYNNEIVDISSLSELTNLNHLYLSNNQINDLSALTGLTKLEVLTLKNNKINDISSLSNMSHLWKLILKNNEIEDISVLSNLRNLQILKLSNNKIKDISSLSALNPDRIWYLSIYKNQISDISSLSALTNLRELYLTNNEISDISPLSEMSQLEVITLRNNDISNISSLVPLNKLYQIKLNENFLDLSSPDTMDIIKILIERVSNHSNGWILYENQKEPDVVDIIFTGDVMLGRGVEEEINKREDILKELNSIFINSDAAVINLEAPFTRETENIDKEIPLKAHPDSVSFLVDNNIRAVSLANNHIMDYGVKGLRETMDLLKSNNILYGGSGNNIEEASRPIYLEIDGKTIAIVCFSKYRKVDAPNATDTSPGQAYYDRDLVKRVIEEASSASDFVVASFHYGREYFIEPVKEQIDISHFAIDCGADFVVGHHPHVTEGIEEYKGKYIFYSLGNFIFDQEIPPRDRSIFIRMLWEGEDVRYIIYPYIIKNATPRLMDTSQGEEFLTYVNSISDYPYIQIKDGIGEIKEPVEQ